ncbi:hypothetical protein Nmel_017186 [Mimus melanotis]
MKTLFCVKGKAIPPEDRTWCPVRPGGYPSRTYWHQSDCYQVVHELSGS